jgi:hypothetical protein
MPSKYVEDHSPEGDEFAQRYFYRRGVNKPYDNIYAAPAGYLPNGDPATWGQMALWAIAIAKKFPGCAFVSGMAYKEEFQRVIENLGRPIPDTEMTDETCVHCQQGVKVTQRARVGTIYEASLRLRNMKAQALGNARSPDILQDLEITEEDLRK